MLESQSGLDRGFDVYADRFEGAGDDAQFLNTVQKKGEKTIEEAVAWLRGTAGRRVFLWLHLYEPHDPYEPPEPYASRYADRPYDGEVAWSDELVGRFDDALASPRAPRRDGYSSSPPTTARASASTTRACTASSPTRRRCASPSSCAARESRRAEGSSARCGSSTSSRPSSTWLGLPAPRGTALSGRSLAAALRGRPGAGRADHLRRDRSCRSSSSAGATCACSATGASSTSRRRGPSCTTCARTRASGTTSSREKATPGRGDAAPRSPGCWSGSGRRGARRGTAPPDETLEKLGALGYVGAGGPAETAAPGADPKDKIDEFRIVNSLIREALLAFHAQDPALSEKKLRQVVARGVQSFEVHYYLARALVAQGRQAEAGPHFDEAARRVPAHAAAWREAAECRLRAGDTAGALQRLRSGQAASPGDASLRRREARLLRELGRREEARRAYEAALPLAPRDARLRAELGELLREMGEVEPAIRRQREAVELDPAVASYWNSLGMTLGGAGQLAEAEQAFREAWRLDDRSHRHAYNLGLILLRQGRGAEARPFFEKALVLQPGFTPARERLAEMEHRAGA